MGQVQPSVLDLNLIITVPADALSHLPVDKMATILAVDIFKCIFLNENVWISIKISLKFVP